MGVPSPEDLVELRPGGIWGRVVEIPLAELRTAWHDPDADTQFALSSRCGALGPGRYGLYAKCRTWHSVEEDEATVWTGEIVSEEIKVELLSNGDE